MMPGRMNPRQMNQMMKRLGINVKEIENVKKVIIQTETKEYIINELLIKKQIIKAHYLGDTFYVGRILSKGG